MKKFTLLNFLLLLSFFSFSQIIHIPADYPTIHQGIEAAASGDTILVNPGTYIENIDISGKHLTVGSMFLTTGDTTYISQTIIDGNQEGTVVYFGEDQSPEMQQASLQDYIFTG